MSLKICFFSALVLTFAAPFAAHAEYSESCPGEEGYYYTNDRNSKNPVEGGFISYDADVSDDIWVGRNAAICGFASVTNSARILGRSIICGNAQVMGRHAQVTGYAKVCGDAVVDGSENDVKILGYFETETGLYDSGTYEQKDSANSTHPLVAGNKKLKAVKRLLDIIDGFKFNLYKKSGDKFKPYNITEWFAQIPNRQTPCFVEIKSRMSYDGNEDLVGDIVFANDYNLNVKDIQDGRVHEKAGANYSDTDGRYNKDGSVAYYTYNHISKNRENEIQKYHFMRGKEKAIEDLETPDKPVISFDVKDESDAKRILDALRYASKICSQ
nr:hypothetical protein [uncultured Cohaesibacter sp.]